MSGRDRCAARRRGRGRPRSTATRGSRGSRGSRPRHVGEVGDHERLGRGAVGRRHDGRRAASRARRPAPASGRTTCRSRRPGSAAAAPDGRASPDQRLLDGQVVLHEIELGVAALEKKMRPVADGRHATRPRPARRCRRTASGHGRRRRCHRPDQYLHAAHDCATISARPWRRWCTITAPTSSSPVAPSRQPVRRPRSTPPSVEYTDDDGANHHGCGVSASPPPRRQRLPATTAAPATAAPATAAPATAAPATTSPATTSPPAQVRPGARSPRPRRLQVPRPRRPRRWSTSAAPPLSASPWFVPTPPESWAHSTRPG